LGARRGAKVHTGFLTAYESIRKPVLQYLYVAREKCKNCKIVVTGHSLGGALAVLAALDFTLKGIKVSSVFTFGCPRVGDPVFAHWWDSRVAPGNAYRFVHRSDLVPHLPPSNMAVKKAFKHVGKELWQTRVVTWSCGYGEHTTCSYKIPFYEGVASDHVKYFGLSGVSLSNPCN
jgi:predicted lipase